MCRLNFVILNDILCGYFMQAGAETEGAQGNPSARLAI